MEKYWSFLKDKRKPYQPLVFIHTPKTGGQYVKNILKSLNIRSIGHNQAQINTGITFTVIRDPVDRVESFINYNIHKPENSCHPLIRPFRKTALGLNEIVSKIDDQEFLDVEPFRSLAYWTKNIDIAITIDKLESLLNFFGYKYNPEDFQKKNVSLKSRGVFNNNTRIRLRQLYSRDYLIWRLWSHSNREYEIEREKYDAAIDKQKKINRIQLGKINETFKKFERARIWYDFKDIDTYFTH